jgi:ABC-2 type transport system ATP-binding protein
MPAAIDIQRVTHRYGDHVALRDVTLTVEPGTLFGLLGPNGGGKTTLFRILSTLLTPTEGLARVQHLDVTARPAAVRRQLGVVFQEPALDEGLTVAENLRYHGALYGLRGAALTDRLQHLADVFGVADRLGDRVQTLSGGLRRRTDLARGLLHRPEVLLLDEPTTGLDPAARHTFWQALARLRQAEGTTLLVATHLMDEAERCDEVGVLDRGRLVAHGTPATLKAALGGETLWLETDDAPALRDRVAVQFDLDARVIGQAVQISHPEAHDLLPALYDAFGPEIDSAMVRRPTLEDVFMVHAGHTFEDATASSPPALQPAS